MLTELMKSLLMCFETRNATLVLCCFLKPLLPLAKLKEVTKIIHSINPFNATGLSMPPDVFRGYRKRPEA